MALPQMAVRYDACSTSVGVLSKRLLQPLYHIRGAYSHERTLMQAEAMDNITHDWYQPEMWSHYMSLTWSKCVVITEALQPCTWSCGSHLESPKFVDFPTQHDVFCLPGAQQEEKIFTIVKLTGTSFMMSLPVLPSALLGELSHHIS